jgi:hypothetical protein
MSTDPGRNPEDEDVSPERVQDEDAARGPGHDDPDEARKRAGLDPTPPEGDGPPLPGPDAPSAGERI